MSFIYRPHGESPLLAEPSDALPLNYTVQDRWVEVLVSQRHRSSLTLVLKLWENGCIRDGKGTAKNPQRFYDVTREGGYSPSVSWVFGEKNTLAESYLIDLGVALASGELTGEAVPRLIHTLIWAGLKKSKELRLFMKQHFPAWYENLSIEETVVAA